MAYDLLAILEAERLKEPVLPEMEACRRQGRQQTRPETAGHLPRTPGPKNDQRGYIPSGLDIKNTASPMSGHQTAMLKILRCCGLQAERTRATTQGRTVPPRPTAPGGCLPTSRSSPGSGTKSGQSEQPPRRGFVVVERARASSANKRRCAGTSSGARRSPPASPRPQQGRADTKANAPAKQRLWGPPESES